MTRKKTLIVGLLFVFCLGLIVFYSVNRNTKYKNLAIALGRDLVSSLISGEDISSKHAIYIGENLQRALQVKKEELKKGHKIQCYSGDASYPFGDEKAQYRLIIKADNKTDFITLRLKYDSHLKKFHILGYFSGE